ILVVFSVVSWYLIFLKWWQFRRMRRHADRFMAEIARAPRRNRSEEHTSELQSQSNLVCRLLLEKKKKKESHKEIACIQSSTSRQNTKDQLYAHNEIHAYQQNESTARVAFFIYKPILLHQQ